MIRRLGRDRWCFGHHLATRAVDGYPPPGEGAGVPHVSDRQAPASTPAKAVNSANSDTISILRAITSLISSGNATLIKRHAAVHFALCENMLVKMSGGILVPAS